MIYLHDYFQARLPTEEEKHEAEERKEREREAEETVKRGKDGRKDARVQRFRPR